VLIVAGTHVPVIPFVDVEGRTGAVLFWHSGPIAAKVGAIGEFVVISRVAVVAH
jgi:hypothetical protein